MLRTQREECGTLFPAKAITSWKNVAEKRLGVDCGVLLGESAWNRSCLGDHHERPLCSASRPELSLSVTMKLPFGNECSLLLLMHETDPKRTLQV